MRNHTRAAGPIGLALTLALLSCTGDDGTLLAPTGTSVPDITPAFLAGAGSLPPIVLSDGDFADANWETVVLLDGSGGTVSATTPATGGNPDSFRRIEIRHNGVTGGEKSQVLTFQRRVGAVHDPAVDGAIESIDYAEDRILLFCAFACDGQHTGPAVRQDGQLYVAVVGNTSHADVNGVWGGLSADGLTAASFGAIDPDASGMRDPNRNPDFSAAGSPLEIGFFRWTTHTGFSTDTRTAGLDNWSLTLNLVQPVTPPPPPPADGAGFVEVPRTGQLFTVANGDDGALRIGAEWPSPRFTDHGDGTVTDHLTGLMWTRDVRLPGERLNWQDALDFVAAMNGAVQFGYSDWRLPNVHELESVIDYDRFEPALPGDHPFVNFPGVSPRGGLPNINHWTSTIGYSPAGGWITYGIDLQVGQEGIKSIAPRTLGNVWAVRTAGAGAVDLPRTGATTSILPGDDADLAVGVEWPDPRFIDNGDGTVYDRLTGLTWAQSPLRDDDGNGLQWDNTFGAVGLLNAGNGLGGHTDWRVPNRREMRSLIDHSRTEPSLPDGHPFDQSGLSHAWTSTTYAGHLSEAWMVRVGGAGATVELKSNSLFVWPVRGPSGEDAPSNSPPTADAGGPYSGSEGTPVSFSGSGSDPDGDPLTFEWDFGDGASATGPDAVHTFADDGTYDVTLSVSDGTHVTVAAVRAFILNVSPAVSPIPDATLLPGETYSAAGAFVDPGADSWSATVDYGDGPGAEPLTLVGFDFQLAHAYAAPGTYAVTVTVTDDDGGAGSASATVTVQTPSQAVETLEAEVAAMVAEGIIARGHGNALSSKLSAARRQLDRGNHRPASGQLGAFINQVEALGRAGRIPAAVAADLTAAARRILAAL